ncbi:MAG: hypothetical protein K0U98_08530 [Deltaproteobacteria bacterium]|nr:hypothetical protein [Deltaproteobacteria bacterium]
MHSFFAFLLASFLAGSLAATPSLQDHRIAASSQVLWVSDDGRVFASGDDGTPRGDRQEGPRNHFEAIPGLSNISAVFLDPESEDGAAALDQEGQVWLWGDTWCARLRSEDACEQQSHVPGRLPELAGTAALALGDYHLIALGKDGKVRTLGGASWKSGNEFGQLGVGDTEGRAGLVEIKEIDDAVAVQAASETSFILRADGTVWGMGNSWGGMLGTSAQQEASIFDGITDASANPRPIRIEGLEKIQAIAIGNRFGLALDRNGQVWGWGVNDSGQLGLPASDLSFRQPSPIAGLRSITAVAAGYDFTLALRRDGVVLALGGNVYGALGDKRGELEGELRSIEGLEGVKQIYGGHYNAFARREDGAFLGWGANHGGVGGFHPRGEVNTILPVFLDADLRRAPASPVVLQGGVAVRIGDELGYDQRSEIVEIKVSDRSLGTLKLNATTTLAELAVELPAGIHPYSLNGKTRMEDGTRRIEGSGFLVVTAEPQGVPFDAAVSTRGLASAIEELQAELERQAPGINPRTLRLETTSPLDGTSLDRLEAELGFPLPAPYRSALAQSGPFRLGEPEAPFPAVALFLPEGSRTLRQWYQEGLAWSAREGSSEVDEDAQWEFEYLADQVEAKLLRAWEQSLLGAVVGLRQYTLTLDRSPCEDDSPQTRWADFFEPDQSEETGEELYFYWQDYAECQLDVLDELHRGASYALQAAYRAAGVVFLTSNPNGEERGLYFERGEDDGETLQLKLVGSGGWDEP